MKEYCSNFIPSIYDFFFLGGGGGSLFEARRLSTFLAIRWALIEVGAYSNKYSIYQVHLRSLGRGLSLGRVLSSMESRYLKTRRKKILLFYPKTPCSRARLQVHPHGWHFYERRQ